MGTCENCKYSEPMVGALACVGQKGMPYVRPTESCDRWKTMKQTNADRIRAMSDEELAAWIEEITEDMTTNWLNWLKQEVSDGDGSSRSV